MMRKLDTGQNFILKWLGFWIGIVGSLTFSMKIYGLTYDKNYILFSIYFLGMGLIGLNIFKAKEPIAFHLTDSKYLLLFIIPTLGFYFSTFSVEYFFPLTKEQYLFYENIGLGFPYFTYRTFITKTSDILYQQVMVLIMVLHLKKQGHTDIKIVKVFSVIFFILHLPLLFVFGWYGLMFILPCTIAGGIFSFLILRYKQGHFYSIMVHQGFYLILGTIMRFVPIGWLLRVVVSKSLNTHKIIFYVFNFKEVLIHKSWKLGHNSHAKLLH